MTTVHHTPITTGAAANAATINAPLSELDTKLGAAKTSGHIIYADASGNLAGAATMYRVPATGNVVIGDASPGDITGATFQVAGDIVVSDGAGGTKVKLDNSGVVTAGKYLSGIPIVIPNNTAYSMTPAGGFLSVILLTGHGADQVHGLLNCRTAPVVFCNAMVASSSLIATTGKLAGTTGTEGKFTVATHTDGKIYFENRLGLEITIDISVIGGS